MALYPDVASHSVNQFDGRNLLWRSVIRYGTSKIWYWPFLMTLAMAPLVRPQIVRRLQWVGQAINANRVEFGGRLATSFFLHPAHLLEKMPFSI